MKHFALDFGHKLLLCSAIAAIIVGGTLNLAKELLPWLPKHRTLIENIIGNTLHQTVRIDRITIGWTKLQPFLQLQNVTVGDLNTHHQPLLTLPEIDLQLNLVQSLWQQHIQFSRITFKKAKFTLYQDKTAAWHIAGSESLSDFTNPKNTSSAFIGWLLSIHHLQFDDFNLVIAAQNWPSFSVNHASVDFKNTAENHQLFAQALVDGPSKAPIALAIHLKGAYTDFPHLNASIYLSIQGLNLQPWLVKKSMHQWQWQQGLIDGQAWAKWHQDHWQSAQISLTAKQLQLTEIKAQPWLIHSNRLDLRATWQPGGTENWHGQMQSAAGQLGFGTLFRSNIPFTAIQAQVNWDDLHVNIPFLMLSTPDIITHAALTLQLPEKTSPIIDLRANAQLLNLNHAALYLPTGIMNPALVHWLDTSIKSGVGGNAQMVLQGPLNHFPFDDHSGLMDIHGQLHGITLNYWPAWPTITDLDADCQFTHQGFNIHSHHGTELGLAIDSIDAVLPHYAAPALLHIHATTHGDLSQGIHFIQQSPLNTSLKALTSSVASGPFALKLNFAIPLSDSNAIQWQSDIVLQRANLAWVNYPLDLSALAGALHLSNNTASSNQLHGQLWGSAINLNVYKALSDSRLHIDGAGTLNSQTLPKAWSFSFIKGVAAYNVQLALSDQTSSMASEFWVLSSLKGLSIQLPSGFDKDALSDAPLKIHGLLDSDGHIERLDATCLLLKQPLNISYQANPLNGQWQVNSPDLSAALMIPEDTHLPWALTINHFRQQAAPVDSTSRAAPLTINLRAIPAMNINGQQLSFGQQVIHHVQLQLRPRNNGIAIENLKLHSDLYQIAAAGNWTTNLSQLTGTLTTKKLSDLLSSFDLPTFIESSDSQVHFNLQWPGSPWQVNFAHLHGHVLATLNNGSLPEVGNNTSSSFGKLLNLLSINSLPQHLSFNFTDLSAKGFGFTRIKGDFTLAAGHVAVPTLTINSALANVNAHGCLNIPEQSYQLVMEVKPHLTSTLPIIATIAAGPIIGAVSLAADMLISPAVSQLASTDYVISGPWANPHYQRYDSYLSASATLHCQ